MFAAENVAKCAAQKIKNDRRGEDAKARRKALDAVPPVSIGGLHVTVNGNADNAAISQIGEKLEAFGGHLPQMINARVQDRQKRGAY